MHILNIASKIARKGEMKKKTAENVKKIEGSEKVETQYQNFTHLK